MVPLCDVAFMPARLKHTNEVHVHLGDSHFVQRTAHECQAIIERRVNVYEQKVKALESQRGKQTGLQDLFAQTNPLPMKNTDSLTTPTAGGIPETKVNAEGHLEIFEAYDSDDNQPDNHLPTKQKVAQKRSQAAAASKIEYVDFQFNKPPSFSNAKSPADLRMAMTAQIEESKIVSDLKVREAPPVQASQQRRPVDYD